VTRVIDEAKVPAEDRQPSVPAIPVLGALLLVWAAATYTTAGLLAYPRQEWLVELLTGAVFVLPVFNLLRGGGSLSGSIRIVGLMLLIHSGWDALHWPGNPVIDTPIDPRIPRICPFLDIPMGMWLLIRGK
jgi:hypothetical protein